MRSLPDDSTSAISTLGVHDDDEDNDEDDDGDDGGDLRRCEFWDGDDDDDVDDDCGGWWLGDVASGAVAAALGTACYDAVDVANDSDVNRESDKEDDDDDVNP